MSQMLEEQSVATATTRLGVVSFINTMPLIDGLENLASLELHRAVPSLLIGKLESGAVDLALCSSIDYQRSRLDTVIVPAGLLGCHGPTLTVRLFATRPIEEVTEIHCDIDSHTSVVLMRILLREIFGREVTLIDFDAAAHGIDDDWPEAVLLIGDKVVIAAPPPKQYPTQFDLGQLWFEHTALPFVFAVWLARATDPPEQLLSAAHILDRQRRFNRQRIDRMIHAGERARQWPRDLARLYLTERLNYEFTTSCEDGLRLFYRKAHEHGFVDRCRDIKLLR